MIPSNSSVQLPGSAVPARAGHGRFTALAGKVRAARPAAERHGGVKPHWRGLPQRRTT